MAFVLDPLIDFVNETTPLFAPWGRVAVVAALFAAAWLVARASAVVARRLVAWHDRRHRQRDVESTAKIVNIKRRETLVSLIRTTISYAAFAAAAVISVGQVTGGVDRITAIAGASIVVVVAGVAAQRLLADMLAGLIMFLEGWYSVGDTIVIAGGVEAQGVVEDVSLRRTKLRALNGETINIHNSQIPAVRVLPRGMKELAVEFFARDGESAERVAREVASILPEGPTTFTTRPWIERVEELSPELVRVRLRAAVAPGSEWLVEGFLPDLLKEKAGDLILHGPVVLAVDERAARSFARATLLRPVATRA